MEDNKINSKFCDKSLNSRILYLSLKIEDINCVSIKKYVWLNVHI